MLESVKETCKKTMAKSAKTLEIISTIQELPECVDSCHFNSFNSCLVFTFLDYRRLHEMRAFVKSVIPEWDGKIGTVWAPMKGLRCVSWEDRNHPQIELRLSCSSESFPKNLSGKDGCKWVTLTDERESFVCGI